MIDPRTQADRRADLERRRDHELRERISTALVQSEIDRRRHQRRLADRRAALDQRVTDWSARFHAARNGTPLAT